MDTAAWKTINKLDTYRQEEESASGTGSINAALAKLHDEYKQVGSEMKDKDQMRDLLESLPWDYNDMSLAASKGIREFVEDGVRSRNAQGALEPAILVETDDLDLYNYRKKGLVIPPVPAVSVLMPDVVVKV